MMLPFYWDFEFFCACPEHGTELLATCPNCDAKLSWTRRCVHQCNCGYDLREFAPKAAPMPVIWYSNLLASILGVGSSQQTFRPPEYIRNISLDDFFYLTEFFGGLDVTSPVRYTVYKRKRENRELASWVARTGQILSGWPKSFHEELECLRREAGMSPRTRFWPIVRHLQTNRRESSFEFVMDEYAKFVERQTEIWQFANPPNATDKAPVRAKSSDLLGVGKTVEKQLIENNVLMTESFLEDPAPILTSEHVRALLSRLDEIANLPSMSDALRPITSGIRLFGRRNIAKIITLAFEGKLQIYLTDPEERGLKRYSISEDQIRDQLLVREIRDQEHISFSSAQSMLKCTKYQLKALVSANVISTKSRNRGKGSGILKSDIVKFAEKHMLCGILAKELGVSHLTLKKIAEFLSIEDIGKQNADGAPIFWYKDEIELKYGQISYLVSLSKDPASLGRPWKKLSRKLRDSRSEGQD